MSGRVHPYTKKELLVNTFLVNDFNLNSFDSSFSKRKIIDRNRSVKISVKNLKNEFYNEMLIIIRMMQFLGVLTIHKNKNGKITAGFLTLPFLYSLTIYSILSFLAYLVLVERIKWYAARSSSFEDTIVYFNTTFFMSSHFLPIFTFFERKKIAKYFDSWYKFQVEYYKVTRNMLTFKMRKREIIILITLIILTIILVCYTISAMAEDRYAFINQLFYPYVIITLYYGWLTTVICTFWYFCMSGVQQAASQLSQDCKESKWNFMNNIEEYRALWVDLKNLCSEPGQAWCLTCMYFYIYIFLMIITGLYALASQNTEMYTVNLYMRILFAGVLFFYMSLIGNSAHMASEKVGNDFKRELFLYLSSEKNKTLKKKLQWFAHNVSIDPPVISLDGYVILNRGFNVSMYASLLTYLVVVMQFKLSGNDRRC